MHNVYFVLKAIEVGTCVIRLFGGLKCCWCIFKSGLDLAYSWVSLVNAYSLLILQCSTYLDLFFLIHAILQLVMGFDGVFVNVYSIIVLGEILSSLLAFVWFCLVGISIASVLFVHHKHYIIKNTHTKNTKTSLECLMDIWSKIYSLWQWSHGLFNSAFMLSVKKLQAILYHYIRKRITDYL